mgnify:CR=1 FL=1
MMLSMTPRAMRFWFYTTPTDMRKGFDGLSGLVRDHCALDPCTGDVFVFISRARIHIKLLYWDGDGFVMYYKRLEQGRFDFPLGTGATRERRASAEGKFSVESPRRIMVMSGPRLSIHVSDV